MQKLTVSGKSKGTKYPYHLSYSISISLLVILLLKTKKN